MTDGGASAATAAAAATASGEDDDDDDDDEDEEQWRQRQQRTLAAALYSKDMNIGFVRSRLIWEIERENTSFSARTLLKLLNGAFFAKKIL